MRAILGFAALLGLSWACHSGPPEVRAPSGDQSRSERAMLTALRWVPTRTEFRGQPVVLMAGRAHGGYRDAWVDSLVRAGVVHHTCTELTVAECPDSSSAVYVAFQQPDLSEDTTRVTMTLVVMNPAACARDGSTFRVATGRLAIPRGARPGGYHWVVSREENPTCTKR